MSTLHTPRWRILLTLVALMVVSRDTAHGETVVHTDAAVAARVARVFGRTAGTVVVYDMQARRVLAVTDPEVACSSLFPPGSVMKLVTAVALLRSEQFDATRSVVCRNHLTLHGRDFTCAVDGGHGAVALASALAKSCSIYFYSMGQRLSPSALAAVGRSLGIGDASPFPGGLRAQWARPASERERTLMLVGEGRGLRITPWDAIVLVTRLHDARDAVTARVYRAMREVVTQGTGRSSAVDGVEVRGKTGTATALDGQRPGAPPRTHGWFACTAGRLAVVVFLKNGTGHDAAAMAGRIITDCKGRL